MEKSPPKDAEHKNWYEKVPKVELHLHLEGAIPYEILWELVQKYCGDPQVPDQEALLRKFAYKDFPHFIETWIWKNQYLREYEDFTYFAEAVARDLAGQNIRYAEAFFSPPDSFRYGLNVQGLAQAIRLGLARVPAIEVALIADVVRDWGPELAARTLAEACEARQFGVIGIGIGGSDYKFTPEPFEKVFENAREQGFHVTAHAGETAGPESIWGAIRSLHVERIGHGVHAKDDERLLAYLAETQLPLEVCPLSNVCTGVVKSIEDHPYRRLEERLRFSRQDIRTLILQGISASWLPPGRKQALSAEFCADPIWQEY